MCDCYYHQCKKCKKMIPVHIADFNYPREALEVFCPHHLPSENATVFTLKEAEFDESESLDFPAGWKCAFRLCDGRIEPAREGVEPNFSNDVDIEILPRKT